MTMINIIIAIVIIACGLIVFHKPEWGMNAMFFAIVLVIPAIMLLTALYPVDHGQECLDKPTEQVVMEIKYSPYRLTLSKEVEEK